jgi:hydrogenase expression/formation protein HypC
MCVATPGKVVEINGDTAVIDYNGNKVNANKGIVDVKIGDYALVHAGLIIQVLPEDEAKSMLELFEELGNL